MGSSQSAGTDYRRILDERLRPPGDGFLHVLTTLKHLALITYALPKSRLAKHIPPDRFTIPEFDIEGERMALLSIVPFVDRDFRFIHLFPFLKSGFAQTNHRAYVIDKKSGQHVAWFFGTTLGSPIVYSPRLLWRLPWHYARYQVDCVYNEAAKKYDRFRYEIASAWGGGTIELEDTGESSLSLEGFADPDEAKLVLTHPVEGFFHRLDGKLATYSIWHRELETTKGSVRDLYLPLYEKLGLLSKEEMRIPHSVLICPEIEFRIMLPPRRVSERERS